MLNRWRLYIHITWRGGCIQGTRDKGRGGRDVQGMLTARQRRFAGVRSRPAAAARFRPGRLFFAGVTGGADLQRARPGAASGANVASASFTGESARRGGEQWEWRRSAAASNNSVAISLNLGGPG